MASRISKNALYVLYRKKMTNARCVGLEALNTGNRGAHTGSAPAAPEYIKCASMTSDKLFQSAFRKPSILKPFLNELLVVDNLIPEKLDHIEIAAEDQQIVLEGEYPMLHDVRARDSKGNAYVIEMERSCGRSDMVRFQYVGYKVFTQLVETKIKKLKQKAKDDAEAANKAIEKARPKRLNHMDVYSNVPTVIVIVIAERGLAKKYHSKFTRDGQYTLVVSYQEVLKDDAKVHFVYVDLSRFAHTGKGRNPETPLDFWCSILVNSRRLGIQKKLLNFSFEPLLMKLYLDEPVSPSLRRKFDHQPTSKIKINYGLRKNAYNY